MIVTVLYQIKKLLFYPQKGVDLVSKNLFVNVVLQDL